MSELGRKLVRELPVTTEPAQDDYTILDGTTNQSRKIYWSKIKEWISGFSAFFSLVQGTQTLEQNSKYSIDTSASAFAVNLPLSPELGTFIEILDRSQTWNVNNLTINRNGQRIEGLLENFVCDVPSRIKFVFVGVNIGWQVIPVPAIGGTDAVVYAGYDLIFKKKSSNQVLASQTTLQNDNDLFFPTEANATYHVVLFFDAEDIANTETKWDIELPTDSVIHFLTYNPGTLETGLGIEDPTLPFEGTNDGLNKVEMVFRTDAVAGDFQFQFAQVTSSASTTTIKANKSMLWAKKLI